MTDEIPKCDHLILLVGGNPLPNAVAAQLLGQKSGQIKLIHSPQTAAVAQRLQSWLKAKEFPLPGLYEVDEVDSGSIAQGIKRALRGEVGRRVGLHYTGGTKAMAIHAYRVLELWAKENNRARPTFSYLDARTLKLIVDPPAPEKGESARGEYVGRAVEIKIDDLLALHGWTRQHEPATLPVLPEVAKTLALLNANMEACKAWRDWVEQELEGKCRRGDRPDKWKNKSEMNQQCLVWPGVFDPLLQDLTVVLQNELNLSGNCLSVSAATDASGYKDPNDFCGWLHGKWLEHYTLDRLQQLPGNSHLHQCVQNIETKDVQFDVDVVALRGYQLFALSCSTDDSKSLLKSKLFEAYIRARQIGGDEARVALISCSNKPADLEREMRRDIDPDGRIRVFGREHLPKLAEELACWIQSQSQEP